MKRRSVLVLLLLLMGCNVGPRYSAPCQESAPCTWKNEAPPQAVPNICYWWEIFNDPFLNAMEQELIANNPTLDSAIAKIQEACALLGVAKAPQTPEVDLTPNYSVNERLFKIFLPGALPGLAPNLVTPFRIRAYEFELPLRISYEFDPWGKRKNRILSAFRYAQAEQEGYCAALLTLTTDLGSSYFHLRFLDKEEELLAANVCAKKKTYELSQSRYENGLTDADNLQQAAIDLAGAAVDLDELRRVRGNVENMIAVLLGRNPSEFWLEKMPLCTPPPEIPAGVPCQILLRRPDLAQAERKMAAEHALIGVAYAELFPSCSLTTHLGFFSPTLADFLTWKSRLWELGVSVFQALWDGGKRRSQIRGAWAGYRELSDTYQAQVLTAFQEVEDALNDLKFEKEQCNYLFCSVESASQLLALSNRRYEEGLINYLEVVSNESNKLEIEQKAIELLNTRYQSTLQLIKALGGSWEKM